MASTHPNPGSPLRDFDKKMRTLFVGFGPTAAFEDRLVWALGAQPRPKKRSAWPRPVLALLGCAAVMLLAVLGMTLVPMIERTVGLAGAVRMEPVTKSAGSPEAMFGHDADFSTNELDERLKYDAERFEGTSVPGTVSPGVDGAEGGFANGAVPVPKSFYGRSGASKQPVEKKWAEGRREGEKRESFDDLLRMVPKSDSKGNVTAESSSPPANASPAPTSFPPGKVADKQHADGRTDGDTKPRLVAQADPKSPITSPAAAKRVIIRSGDIEFEVDSFDYGVGVVSKLIAAIPGAFVATTNSDKLANGKVKGAIVVRIPPEHLDEFVLKLRADLAKAGELKSQRIGSQDVTKQYTDLESRLKAARTMEERLLKIIKDGQAQVKDLLQVEKELGVWRTKIEEMEGELRYFSNLASLSTLTIHLTEKEIRVAAQVVESERIQAGIEVDDVEKAYQTAKEIIQEAKGRVSRSEMKQHAAGRFNATLQFEVAPEAAGGVRDRLRQLGNMVRLDIDRVQKVEGSGKAALDAKVRRGDTQFAVSIYNLASVEPRETATIAVASADVPASYQKLRDVIAKLKGHVRNASLQENDRQNVTARLEFDVRRTDEAAVQAALGDSGEIVKRTVTRRPEGDGVSDAKVSYHVDLIASATVPPRETIGLTLEVAKVEATIQAFGALVKEQGGRVLESKIRQERSGQMVANVTYDVPLAAASGLVERFKSDATSVRSQKFDKDAQAPDGKMAVARIQLVVANELLLPRDEGFWSQIKNGLSISLRGLTLSASWLIVAVLFVLPWVLVLYVLLAVARRLWRRRDSAATGATTE